MLDKLIKKTSRVLIYRAKEETARPFLDFGEAGRCHRASTEKSCYED
jgi:hypothetical protein